MNRVREIVFWFIDLIKGSPIKNDFNEISTILNDKNRVHANSESLKKILEHAVTTTRYYAAYSAGNFESFPVINKSIIRDQIENFRSIKFTDKMVISVVTSGSTGTPFQVYHDQRKKNRNSADTLYFAGLTGFKPGDALAYFKIWAKEKMTNPMMYWVKNMWTIDVLHLDDKQIKGIIERIKKTNGPIAILGYVSALEQVCRYLDRSKSQPIPSKVTSIITMSEALNSYVKDRLLYYFSCHVYSRYSNLENGIIAQQVPESGNKFLINSASYFVEVLKMDKDRPAAAGEFGRIVVTDLFNYAMPLIRYDTGDIGRLTFQNDKVNNNYFEEIEGRKLDILYDTKGNIVSSYIMYKNMWKYTDIKQYQLIQKDNRHYVLKLNVERDYKHENQIKQEFLSYLGDDATFEIVYVSEIPLLNSGKRRKLVNEMHLVK